jgi:hypothetical protein
MIGIGSFKRFFMIDVLCKINEKRDNGAVRPLLRIFPIKECKRWTQCLILLRSESVYLKHLNTSNFVSVFY